MKPKAPIGYQPGMMAARPSRQSVAAEVARKAEIMDMMMRREQQARHAAIRRALYRRPHPVVRLWRSIISGGWD